MRILLLFLDGVGIGKRDPTINPMFTARMPVLSSLLGGKVPHLGNRRIFNTQVCVAPINATLRMPGLPQSGTGQTTLFTGINAARINGRHFGPYPPSEVRPLLESHNIFRQLLTRGKSVVFANAFPEQFFQYTRSGTRRLSATTMSCMMAGVPLLTAKELRNNEAVSADLTRERWRELGYPDIGAISAPDAGAHLAALAARHDFTLFEYWLPDHAGHRQDMGFAVEVLEQFDAFLGGVLRHVDRSHTLVVVTSDHGNVEDLSVKMHTRNPVPCLASGPGAKPFVSRIRSLMQVTPAILDLLDRR